MTDCLFRSLWSCLCAVSRSFGSCSSPPARIAIAVLSSLGFPPRYATHKRAPRWFGLVHGWPSY